MELTFPGKKITCRRKNSYLELEHPFSSFDPIVGLEGEGPVMAGCFENRKKRAFSFGEYD